MYVCYMGGVHTYVIVMTFYEIPLEGAFATSGQFVALECDSNYCQMPNGRHCCFYTLLNGMRLRICNKRQIVCNRRSERQQ